MNRLRVVAVTAAIAALLSASVAFSAPTKLFKRRDAIAGQYIVVLADEGRADEHGNARDIIDELVKTHGGTKRMVWTTALKGAAVDMTEQQAETLSRDPRVLFVEQNARINLQSWESPRSWALDRLDNRVSPRLDNIYNYCSTGWGVRLYVVDTGVWAGHDEFWDASAAKSRVVDGWDADTLRGYPNTSTNPCYASSSHLMGTTEDWWGSHGTAVASVAAGRTLGVARNATIVPVRINGCGAYYQATVADAIAGLNWIPNDPNAQKTYYDDTFSFRPRVVNLSWVFWAGGGPDWNETQFSGPSGVEVAIRSLVNQGITVVASAGNFSEEVGTKYVPARMPEVITVGGTMGRNATDADARWTNNSNGQPGSNYGSAVKIWAPADLIPVAHWATGGSNDAYAIRPVDQAHSSGTSFSAALVSGVAARYLQTFPMDNGASILTKMINDSTNDASAPGFNILDRQAGSPNRLLYFSSPAHCR